MSEWINAMHRNTKTNQQKMVNVAFSVMEENSRSRWKHKWWWLLWRGWLSEWCRPLQSLDMRGAKDVYPAMHMTVSNQVLSHSTSNTLGEKYSLGVYFLLVYISQLIRTNLFPLLANIKMHLLYNSKRQKNE